MTKRYLLDTGPAFDCMFRRHEIHERVRTLRQRGARVGICVPVLGEIISGVEASASRERTWEVVRRTIGSFALWPYDKPAAHEFGRIFADLKRRGRPIQQVDIMMPPSLGRSATARSSRATAISPPFRD
ncbi:MAG: type II toxin-antitoxin system VapC family toxin [Planctomycetaceae bacterium]